MNHVIEPEDDDEATTASEHAHARILMVDDEPQEAANALVIEFERHGICALAVTPSDVTRAHLDDAVLILVDQRLEHWTQPRDDDWVDVAPSEQHVAMRPAHGVALAAVLRSQLASNRVRGVALLSANLHDLVEHYSLSVTEHAAARLHDLEWAFAKTQIEGLPSPAVRIISLANAIETTASAFAEPLSGDAYGVLNSLLELPDGARWALSAGRDVRSTSPPVHQFAEATAGLSVVRWLAQRVLPYPTFLVDPPRAALMLGIEPTSFAEHAEALAPVLEPFRYTGPLEDFANTRWWVTGLRSLALELVGELRPSPMLASAITERAGVTLRPMEPANAVICVDAALERYGLPVAREAAVRIRSDDWPAYAETGWMSRAYLDEHPEHWDLVDPADQPA